jgi:Lar family restriction alleviation protein
MTLTILPCPFCGHDDVEIDEMPTGSFAVFCPECESVGPNRETVMEAICFWNDRRGVAEELK